MHLLRKIHVLASFNFAAVMVADKLWGLSCIFGCWRSITKAFVWGIGSIGKPASFLSYSKFLWSLPF